MATNIIQPGTGLQGPTGPTGPTGATGPTGPTGPAGGALASATEVEITSTSAQTILTYTPAAAQQVQVGAFLRLTAAATVTVKVGYTDAGGTAQSYTLLDAVAEPIGDVPLAFAPLSVGADAITVTVTASVADAVWASASILSGLPGTAPIPSFDTTVLTKLSLAPVAYWKLNDPVGSTTAADSSGNGYTLSLTGTVTFGEPSIVPTDSETCALGGGGTLGVSTLPAKIPVGDSPFTVIAVVKASSPGSGTVGVVGWNGADGPLVGFSGNAAFWSTAAAAPGHATAPAAGESHLWGACWDGASGTFSIDGAQPLAPGNGTPPTGTAGLYLFSYLGTGDYFTGYLGRVAIFAGALTPKDWALLMQAFTGVG